MMPHMHGFLVVPPRVGAQRDSKPLQDIFRLQLSKQELRGHTSFKPELASNPERRQQNAEKYK